MCQLCADSIKQPFINLHNHPSSKDTFGTIETFVLKAKQLGQNALAKTDHGGAHGHDLVFAKACEKHGVKPIFGSEVYLRLDKQYVDEIYTNFGVIIEPKKKFHLTLLCETEVGYENLIKLNNIAKINKTNTVSLNDVFTHKQGLFFLTGCISSPFQQLDLNVAKWLLDLVMFNMDKNHIFIETHVIQNNQHVLRAYELQKHSGLYNITTNDAHFADSKHGDYHKMFCEATMHFQFESKELYLATAEDIIKRCHDYFLDDDIIKFVYKGIKNAVHLSSLIYKIDDIIFKQGTPYLPPIDNAKEKLRNKVYEAFNEYKRNLSADQIKVYEERIEEELNVIGKTNYEGYFLILQDVVEYALKNNVAVGNGRGSAAGSLVVYFLALTKINPIKNKLLFARFLSALRVTMPDIDIDFGSSDRQMVIDYFCSKYNAVQVAVYGTFSTKSILQYFAKPFKLPYDLTKKARDLEVEPEDNQYLQRLFNLNPEFKEFFDTIYEQIRTIGTHPGGVVILPPDSANRITPLELDKNGNTPIAYSEGMNRSDLSYMGFVKFDILGVKSIESIAICERLSGEMRPDFNDIPDEVYNEIFATGKTSSIFQFNSVGVRDYLKDIKPTKFEDIVDVNALWRASTMEAGTTKAYARSRKSGHSKVYSDVVINDILSPTYGHIVYQEQFMQLYAYATNVTFEESDIARRAIVKAKEDKIEEIKKDFIKGLQSKGVDDKTIDEIWQEIYSQRKYSFNKAHAVAYATTALHMAYYKWKYPVIFAASALNTRPKNEWMEIILELMLEDIEISSPTINNSSIDFTVENGKLYAPLGIIKGFGNKTVEHIIEERRNGFFKSVEDLIQRTKRRNVNSSHIKIIVQLGLLNYNDIEEVYKLLKIKKDEDKFPTTISYIESKNYFTDLLIPPKKAITLIKNNKKQGNIIGYVVQHDKKKSKGDYEQYVISPNRIIRVQKGHEPYKNLTMVLVDSRFINHFTISDKVVKVNEKY